MSDLKHRGEALRDIIAISIRQELRDEYKLDLGEMYLFIDYVGVLNDEIDTLRTRVVQMEKQRDSLIRALADEQKWRKEDEARVAHLEHILRRISEFQPGIFDSIKLESAQRLALQALDKEQGE